MAHSDVDAILKRLDAWIAEMDRCDTPAVRRVRRFLSSALAEAEAEPALVLAVADALVSHGTWVDRLIAYETDMGTGRRSRPSVRRGFCDGLSDWPIGEQWTYSDARSAARRVGTESSPTA